MGKKFILVSSFAIMASGCTLLGPNYRTPELTLSEKFVGGASQELREAAQIACWRSFSDPVLNEFVSVGLTQNLDVRGALERIVAARENTRRFGISQQVAGDISLDARRSKATDGTFDNDASLGADAFFVFDIFGEFARGRERSLAQLEAAEFDAGTVRLAYLTDIVSSYILVRYYQSAAGITRQSISSRRNTLGLVRQRVDADEGTQLELAQAQSLLASAEASLPILDAQARVHAYRIATLINVPTTTVLSRLSGGRGMLRPSGGDNSGVPADLLRNRPDIRTAERQLAAATASIGIAEAQLYPSLRLAGTITGDPTTWAFGPSLLVPLLDQPSRRASRNIARSGAREAELNYRREVVIATEEVQTALALTNARRRQVNGLSQAVSASERVLDLSNTSYQEGLTTFDEVLDAERTRLSNRLELAFAMNEWAQAWVQLQVSVGKGWGAASDATLVASLN